MFVTKGLSTFIDGGLMKVLMLGFVTAFFSFNVFAGIDCVDASKNKAGLNQIISNANNMGSYSFSSGFGKKASLKIGDRVRSSHGGDIFTILSFSDTGVYGKKMGITIKGNLYEVKKYCVAAVLAKEGSQIGTHVVIADDLVPVN